VQIELVCAEKQGLGCTQIFRKPMIPRFCSGKALILLLVLGTGNALAMTTESRVALISGSNKGIGKEIARKFASDPLIIPILACRTNGKQVAQELGCKDYVHLDLTDDSSIKACRAYVEEKFGKLDILVNNAAICFNDPTLYGVVPYTPFEQQAALTVNTNYFGTRKLTDALLPMLKQSTAQPRIINMASYAGRLGILRSKEKKDTFTDPNLTTEQLDQLLHEFVRDVEGGTYAEKGWPNTCYGMSKLGLIAWSKILARDHPDIYVNSVDPGYCATDQNKNQGNRPAERGAVTPYLLATTSKPLSGLHWFDEQEMPWSYQT